MAGESEQTFQPQMDADVRRWGEDGDLDASEMPVIRRGSADLQSALHAAEIRALTFMPITNPQKPIKDRRSHSHSHGAIE
jgi:hypothetical protein